MTAKEKNGPYPRSNLCFQLQRSKMLVHLSSYYNGMQKIIFEWKFIKDLDQRVLHLEPASEPPGPYPRDSDSVGLGWGLMSCISNKFPDDPVALLWVRYFENCYSRYIRRVWLSVRETRVPAPAAPPSHMTLGKSLQYLSPSFFVCKTEMMLWALIHTCSVLDPLPRTLVPFRDLLWSTMLMYLISGSGNKSSSQNTAEESNGSESKSRFYDFLWGLGQVN